MELKVKLKDEIHKKISHAKDISSTHPDRSISLSKQAHDMAKSHKLESEEGYALLNIAFANRAKSNISGILDYSYRAFKIFERSNDYEGQARSLNLVGIAYFYSSIYEEALKSFLEAIDLLKINNNKLLLINILNNIGEIYRESDLYDKAIEYYNKAIDIIDNKDCNLSQAAITANMGQIYFAKRQFTKALEIYNRSYNILTNSNDIIGLGEVENRIGKTHYVLGDLKKAEEYYFKSLNRLEDINNKYYAIDTLINIAELYMERSSDKALDFYKKAVIYAEDVDSKKKLCNIYSMISKYYENKSQYKASLEYYKKHSNIKEEVISLNLTNKLEILNIEIKNIENTEKIYKIRRRLEDEINRQKNELENIKITNKMLEKKAYEDELTGIKNRRSLNKDFESILKGKHSNDENIVLFMIDIDKFKRYNDYWGHSEGDICLKKISACIKNIQASRSDIFGRYGGEEFVYISHSIDFQEAKNLGNFIRTEVENLGLYYMDRGEKRKTTISVGGVVGPKSCFTSMSRIIELSDKELYRAKDMGRNITILKNLS